MLAAEVQVTETISKSFRKDLRNLMGKQGTTESSPTGHRTRTSENTIVKVQIFSVGNEITYTIFCSGRIGRILCTLETWFLSDTYL